MKKWNVINKYQESGDIIESLLKTRGVTSEKDIQEFLNPPKALNFASAFTPEFKSSLLKAKKLILETMEQDIPIVIHGDYDADGICSTAILFNTLKFELGYENTFSFIPNRFEHGYGLSTKSIDEIIQKTNSPEKMLFITVDSGITSVTEVEYIKSLGYKIILTDHHQKPAQLPQADVLVWSDLMVGAGISWFLSKTLGSKNPQSIALATLATVTDLQPLVGINRSIVKEGLEVINTNPPAGLKKLLQVAGRGVGEVTTYDLGWVLGPRINASGRLVDASDSLLLMVEKNEELLEGIALKLNQTNTERQDKTLEMYEFASGFNSDDMPKIIISAHEDYHEGIIGLVAAKLVQKYYRPAIVISLNDGFGKGSVRSIPGIDIISVLRKHEELFINVGGHPMAAGFTIEKGNLPLLQKRLTQYCSENFDDSIFEPCVEVDMQIPLGLVNLELAHKLNKLKPYGVGNREPVFLSEKVGVAEVNTMGRENNHLLLRLYADGEYFKAIAFNNAVLATELNIGDQIDVVYKIKENKFNGNIKLDLIIEDFKKHT